MPAGMLLNVNAIIYFKFKLRLKIMDNNITFLFL
jgi:hypothetical protein